MVVGRVCWDFHDATLRRLPCDWAAARVSIELTTADRDVVIEATGLSRLEVNHREEWGPSVSVNTVLRRNHRLDIEMQSGDMITVEALRFTLPD